MDFDPDAFLRGGQTAASTATEPDQKPIPASEGGFDPDRFLNGQAQESLAPATRDEATPAMGAYIPGATNIGPIAQGGVKPFVDIGRNVIQGYRANPLGAVIDYGLASHGLPPVMGSASAIDKLGQMYQGVKQGMQNIGGEVSEGVVQPNGRTSTMKPYYAVRDAVRDIDPALYRGMQEAGWNGKTPGTGKFNNDAVLRYLNDHPEIRAASEKDPALAAKIADYDKAGAGILTRAGRVAAPVLRTISKVAGPIGAALEAGQGYNQAQAGDRTGAGLSGLGAASMLNPLGLIAQPGLGMMQSANENFRQQPRYQQRESVMDALSGTAPGMAGEYIPQSVAPVKPVMETQTDKINKAIRLKAAQQALKPIAPGQ